MIEIAKIRTDGGTQSRAAINLETVAEYAEAMRQPETVFPPVILYYDGREYWLADGFHRVEAWREVGRIEVPAEIRQGDRRQAILHSCAANAAHGLRRTNADKRRAVWTLVADAEWGAWSDRQIAKQCGVSHTFVANLRREISGEDLGESGNGCHSEAREVSAQARSQPVVASEIPTGSKPDQETHRPQAAETATENPKISDEAHQPAAADQDAAPDPHAKLRREFRALTPEGQEDDWIGLREEVADLRNRVKTQTSMIADLKRELKELTGDDKTEVIRRLQASVKNAERDRWKALQDRDAYHNQVYALKKRVEELQKIGVAY
ncbi:ParB N-terminal domain-containing protein [Roseovarius mucosus]|uniref:ParB N-terminal domain-containing protein n=1 Tax=Roseovarius mucosus TaxID=215743 RepID=UPI0035CE9E77